MGSAPDVFDPLLEGNPSWNSGLMACCDDRGICCDVAFCPLTSLHRLHYRAFGDCGANPGCLLEHVDRNFRLIMDELLSGTVRNRLKFIFGIRSPDTVWTTCCCLLCTLCQEEREVKIRDAELTPLLDEAASSEAPSSPTAFER